MKSTRTESSAILTEKLLTQFQKSFLDDPKNILAQNICSRYDPIEACLSRKVMEGCQHVFNYKIENEGKPVTNQKSSGRCWMFAGLNVMRTLFMKELNIEEFEFSQLCLFFWDKLEKANYYLNTVVKIAQRGETVDGRLMAHLLQNPSEDGGQWDMFVNLVNKYGVMPKKCFPETFASENSSKLNSILRTKLREYTKELRSLFDNGSSEVDMQNKIEQQMEEVYRILGICLSVPPETFTWEYYDKQNQYHSIGPISPKNFYLKHVKPLFNVDDKVCLVNDPRPTSPFGQGYTVDCLNNMVGGRDVFYNNQPIEVLMNAVAESIKTNEAVWFGCEVSKRYYGKTGIQDLQVHDYKLLFGTDVSLPLSKADRLLYGESLMTHAMVLTGVSVNENGDITKWRVENSWGDAVHNKGYIMMTADWFKEFVFEVVVDKKYLAEEVMKVFETKPTVLPAWDPMGALA